MVCSKFHVVVIPAPSSPHKTSSQLPESISPQQRMLRICASKPKCLPSHCRQQRQQRHRACGTISVSIACGST
eukprot:752710-Hanusia_phi.AAC.7